LSGKKNERKEECSKCRRNDERESRRQLSDEAAGIKYWSDWLLETESQLTFRHHASYI